MRTKKTVILMGYTCNNKCVFCFNDDKRGVVAQKGTKEIMIDILNARKRGSTYLELIGGEPTIRKDIFKIVNYAKNLAFDTIMFATNGRMFSNKGFAKKIIENGVNHLVFSIHGQSADIHDRLTGVPGSFNQLLRGIENLRNIGFMKIGSNTTIVKQNYKYLVEIGKAIYGLGIRNSEFVFVDPTRGSPKKKFFELVPTYEETSPYINRLLSFGRQKGVKHWHIRYYPWCFLDKSNLDRISEIQEVKAFHVEHIAPDFVDTDVEVGRKNISRVKIGTCEFCEHNSLCEGYWREYVNQYGCDNEFIKRKG